MPYRTPFFSVVLFVLVFLVLPGVALAGDPAVRCEVETDRAVGRYSACLLRVEARAARGASERKLDRLARRCDRRFDRAVATSVRRHREENCPPDFLVNTIQSRAREFAQTAAAEAAGFRRLDLLFFQSAEGATLTNTELVLTRVRQTTGWFADRPYQQAGKISTDEFVLHWDDPRPDSFAEISPNADFSCEVDERVVDVVVTLSDPMLSPSGSLRYGIEVVPGSPGAGEPVDLTCDGAAHLFVDVEGCYDSGGQRPPVDITLGREISVGRSIRSYEFSGTAQGGSVELEIAGVTVTVVTVAGQTADDVGSSMAEMINNHSTLAEKDVTATLKNLSGSSRPTWTVSTELIRERVEDTDDPGLTVSVAALPNGHLSQIPQNAFIRENRYKGCCGC